MQGKGEETGTAMEAGRAAIAISLRELPNVISNFSVEKTYTTIPSPSPNTSQVKPLT
jgi:hypothetical protein